MMSAQGPRSLRLLAVLGLALSAACNEIPKDPERTLERIRGTHRMSVGLIGLDGKNAVNAQLFVNQIASETQSRPALEPGPAEELLSKLESGELDLVVGAFHASSPWTHRVTFVPSLDRQAETKEQMVIAAAARNGENAWIGVLHGHVEALGGAR